MDGNLSCSSCWDSFGTLTLPGREIRVEDEEGNGPVMRVWASERERLEEWRRRNGIFAGLFCVAMDCFLVTETASRGRQCLRTRRVQCAPLSPRGCDRNRGTEVPKRDRAFLEWDKASLQRQPWKLPWPCKEDVTMAKDLQAVPRVTRSPWHKEGLLLLMN